MRSSFLAFFFLLVLPGLASAQEDFHITNTDWNGISKLYQATKEMGYTVKTEDLNTFLSASPRLQKKRLLIILHPDEIDSNALFSFVSNGGKVLIADDFGMGSLALREFGIRFGNTLVSTSEGEYNYNGNPKFPVIDRRFKRPYESWDHPIMQGVNKIVANYPTYITFTSKIKGNFQILAYFPPTSFADANYNGIRDAGEVEAGYPFLVHYWYGDGEVVVIADPSIFINEMLELGDNKKLYENILQFLAGKQYTVVFPERGLMELRELPSNAGNPWMKAWNKGRDMPATELDLGVAYIQNPYEVVFTSTPAFTSPSSRYYHVPYWRVDAYDYYTGDKWLKTDNSITPVKAAPWANVRVTFQISFNSSFIPIPVGPYPVNPVVTRISKSSSGLASAYSTPYDSIFIKTAGIYRAGEFGYGSNFVLGQVKHQKIKKALTVSEELQGKYTQLPPSVPSSVKNLAQSLRNPKADALEQAQIIADYLKQNFEYDADLANGKPIPDAPLPNQDITEWFLNRKKGISTHFATMQVVLLRELGIPARIVVGYTPGIVEGNVRKVMNGHAHAWTEVYVKPYGWVSIDPAGSTDDPVNLPPNSGVVMAKIEKYLKSCMTKLGEAKDMFYSGDYQKAYEKAQESLRDLENAEVLASGSKKMSERLIKKLEEEERLFADDPKIKTANAIKEVEEELGKVFDVGSPTLVDDPKAFQKVRTFLDLASLLPFLLIMLALLSLRTGTKYELTILSLFKKKMKPTSEFKMRVTASMETGDYTDSADILGDKFLKALESKFKVEVPAGGAEGRLQGFRERMLRSFGLYLDPYKAKLAEEVARQHPNIKKKRIYKLLRRFDMISKGDITVKEKEMKHLYKETSEILKIIGGAIYEKERRF